VSYHFVKGDVDLDLVVPYSLPEQFALIINLKKIDFYRNLAELMVDKAMELKYAGGVFGGNIKPTPFLCLILKMLQIQPEKDIIVEFIRNGDFKYMTQIKLACINS
jgi:hypothetical protein